MTTADNTQHVDDRRVYPRLSVPAREGCTCSACRGERRRKLGRDTVPDDEGAAGGSQTTLKQCQWR